MLNPNFNVEQRGKKPLDGILRAGEVDGGPVVRDARGQHADGEPQQLLHGGRAPLGLDLHPTVMEERTNTVPGGGVGVGGTN